MRGDNPKRGPVSGDGSTLAVVECFATLQGEGPYAGWPAVFVRLGGCNLACAFCDTEFERFSERPLTELLEEVERLAQNVPPSPCLRGEELCRLRSLIVITGGEPLRQPIAPLCEALLARGFTVQIETNGTLWRALPDAVSIVCSPKATDGAYHPIRPDVLARAQALKFLISADTPPYETVPDWAFASGTPIYVQPMDAADEARNAANRALALTMAQERGYRLSLQLHKILGIA